MHFDGDLKCQCYSVSDDLISQCFSIDKRMGELPASTLDIGEQMVEDSNWRVRGIQHLATRWSRNSDHNCVVF